MSATVPLAEFDPPVAAAVVTVLRRAGLPVALADDAPAGAEEVMVVVAAERREDALAAMASSMEAISEELERGRTPVRTRRSPAPVIDTGEDGEEHRPLVFERLRSLGFLPVLLVPLMVVTLSQTRLPAIYAIAIIVGGGMAIVAWRDGRRRRNG